jgi:uncharacterized protein (TIGR04255 family)
MAAPASDLPGFEAPPVVELALGVQFEPLQNFRTVHFGAFWKKISKDFPHVEEKPPLGDIPEKFGIQIESLTFNLVEGILLPRLWFLNSQKNELIQLQQNRFVYNWRRQNDDDSYPHYSNIRTKFISEYERLAEFLKAEDLGDIKPTACEITYVNHIVSNAVWSEFGDFAKVFTIFNSNPQASFLPVAESVRFASNYVIKNNAEKAVGRLRATVAPEVRRSDGKKLFVMNMAAVGVPESKDLAGVLSFLDVGHEWIVKGFEALTTEDMQAAWGKDNA